MFNDNEINLVEHNYYWLVAMFDNQKYFCKALGGWYAQLELILMMRRINKYLVET